jgi:uncharacterized protein YndB with AHSA1/START domain
MSKSPDERILHKESTVSSPVDRVWWAWTTSEGMATWWAKNSWIELRLGGPYELYFLLDQRRGWQGSEGCRILSYCPNEMLSFTWNFPPSIPEIRSEHTWVVIRFVRLGRSKTKLVLDQLGWKKGRAWNAGWKYFDEAWEMVLHRFQGRFPATDGRRKHG